MKLIVTHDQAMAKASLEYKLKSINKLPNAYNSHSLAELLSVLPVISKKELSDFTESAQDRLLHDSMLFSETSGTTLSPLATPRNVYDFSWNVINQIFSYKRHLQPGTDRIAILHPSILSPFIEASAQALQSLNIGYVRVFPIAGICDYQRIYSIMEKYKITAIMSTPSLVYKLLHEFYISGMPPLKNLRKILLTGEFISIDNIENMRKLLIKDTEILPFIYGASETASLMYGIGKQGYKGFNEDFIFEIVNDEPQINNEEVKSLTGNLVVTWLREGAIPIIRYDTKDIFKVTKLADDFIFYPLGRAYNKHSLSYKDTNKFDKLLYNFEVPIYNYHIGINIDARKIKVSIIPLSTPSSGSVLDLIIRIKSILSVDWHVEVVIKNDNSHFYQFSPKPKFENITLC